MKRNGERDKFIGSIKISSALEILVLLPKIKEKTIVTITKNSRNGNDKSKGKLTKNKQEHSFIQRYAHVCYVRVSYMYISKKMIPLFYNYPIYVPIFTRGTDNSKKKKPIQKEKKKKESRRDLLTHICQHWFIASFGP